MKRFNLVIVHTPGEQDVSDWQTVAAKIETSAPDIEVRIANNLFRNVFLRQWQATRPSLVFSASIMRKFEPHAGTIYAGRAFSKAEELRRLSQAGVNVPLTTAWSRDLKCLPEVWGERVIVKPSRGKRGSGIELLPATRLHEYWHSITRGGLTEFLVQRFVDTGPQPSHYRVLTGFGIPLYMIRQWAMPADGRQPTAPHDARWRLNSNGNGHVDMLKDEAVLSVARAMAAALGEIPVLGCDLVREESTGMLYALETNGFGQTWHFSSDTQKRYVAETGVEDDYYSQFDGLTRLANELVNRTRAEAA